jgi:hypothetical protein
MPTLVLVHPNHGEIKRLKVVDGRINYIIDRWKKMIGKKFFECNLLKYPDTSKKMLADNKISKILYIKTGEYFTTMTEASNKTGISMYHIKHELRLDAVPGHKYNFKLVTIDIQPIKLNINARQ